MRRAFTLLELLVIVAIIATMVAVCVVSIRAGQDAARVKGAARDVLAVIRHGRSVALVTQQPSIVTYATEVVDGETCAKVEIVSAKILNSADRRQVYTLSGKVVDLSQTSGDDDAPPEAVDLAEVKRGKAPEAAADGKTADDGKGAAAGQTVEDILFAPISTEVLRGMCVKVLAGDEQLEVQQDEEVVKNKISVFSNVDYLIGRYRDAKKSAEEEKKKDDGTDSAPSAAADHSDEVQEPKSMVWEVNGRCEPHSVWIYPSGSKPEKGLQIRVDRFGAVKVLGGDEGGGE